jgi:hypothetical protein
VLATSNPFYDLGFGSRRMPASAMMTFRKCMFREKVAFVAITSITIAVCQEQWLAAKPKFEVASSRACKEHTDHGDMCAWRITIWA